MSEIKLTQTKTKASASLQPNNLVYNDKYYAFVSKNEVYLVDHMSNLFSLEKAEKVYKCAYADKETVTSIASTSSAVAGLDKKVLVLCTAGGTLAAFDETGETLIASHKLQKSQVALSAKDAYLRGIACKPSTGSLYFGAGSSDVLLFKLTSGKLSLIKKNATSFARAIWALAIDPASSSSSAPSSSSPSVLAAGDEAGNVTVFTHKGDSELERSWDWKGSGSPITCCAIQHGLLVTGDVNGKVRIYSLDKRALIVEVAAHSRNINGIAVHPTLPMMAVASEDTFLSVWTLPAASSTSVKNLLMYAPAPALLTGVVFSGKNAEQIVCTIYDSKSLFCIPTPKM